MTREDLALPVSRRAPARLVDAQPRLVRECDRLVAVQDLHDDPIDFLGAHTRPLAVASVGSVCEPSRSEANPNARTRNVDNFGRPIHRTGVRYTLSVDQIVDNPLDLPHSCGRSCRRRSAIRPGNGLVRRRVSVTEQEYRQKDHEYWSVVLDSLKLQRSCEMAGMAVQAAQAREIRRQASERLVALSIASGPKQK